jgi:hypothetical protein
MSALGLAIAVMHPIASTRERLSELVDRRQFVSLPSWVRTMGDITVTETASQQHVLRDGDNVLISWRWPDGGENTMLTYVDNNLGNVVKDAFPVPESMAVLNQAFERHSSKAESTLEKIRQEDAKARISYAMVVGDTYDPPFSTDSWPMCRPWLEWLLRCLPDGGHGLVKQAWSQHDQSELMNRYLSSKFAPKRIFDDASLREIVAPLICFGVESVLGDPLRWSPVNVEILLTGWYVNRVPPMVSIMDDRLPFVLESFARFCHHERAIPLALTVDTEASIARWSSVYYRLREEQVRLGGSMVGAVNTGISPMNFAVQPTLEPQVPLDPLSTAEHVERAALQLEEQAIAKVGGKRAYELLNDDPLPDVEFDWIGVSAESRVEAKGTLELLDRWSVEFFDREIRTIARKVLATVLCEDPAVFRRSPSQEGLAAAILGYLLSRYKSRGRNEQFAEYGWIAANQKLLGKLIGVSGSSVNARSKTVKNVIDRSDIDWSSMLHSVERRELLRTKALLKDYQER